MRKLKLFFACLLMAVLSIGQVWGEEATIANTDNNGTCVWTDGTATITQVKWAGSTNVNNSYATNLRVYGGHVLLCDAGEGNTWTSFEYTVDTKYYGKSVSWGSSAAEITSSNYTSATAGTGSLVSTSGGSSTLGFTANRYAYIYNSATSSPVQLRITAFTATYEKSGGSTPPTPSKTLESVAVSGNPTKTSYTAGENFDPAGLIVTGHYSDNSDATITSGITWSYNPSQTLALNQTSIGVTATVNSIASAEYPVSITVAAAPAADSYEKVTSAPEDWSGEYLLVYENGNNAHVWTGADAANCYVSATISNNVIAKPEGAVTLTIAKEGTGYSLLINGGANNGKYLTDNANNAALKFATTAYAATFSYESNWTKILFSQRCIRFNNGTNSGMRFRYYAATSQQPIQLYKKATASLPSAELAFADASHLVKLGDAFTAPELTNPHSVAVTYASSNTNVAEVASNGAVTIKALGVAVITASFAGNDDYKAGSASYTICVVNHLGAEADPFDVADARRVIDAFGTKEGVYMAGIVSQITTPYDETYHNISFDISTDGTPTADQVRAYRCKGLDNIDFTSEDDVKTGATVTVYGDLKKYNSTYEFDAGCYLKAYEAPAVPKTHIANTKETAYTVAQALTYAADGATYDLDDYVYISGVVYDVQNFNNGKLSIFIKDADAENQFELYNCAGINDGSATTPFESINDVKVGNVVIGYGQMMYYQQGDIYEFKAGNYLAELQKPITGVWISEFSAEVEAGATYTLTANVQPSNATGTIDWTVESGAEFASVENGVVTGIAEGEAVIRATAHGTEFYKECTVTVTAAPAPDPRKIAISPATFTTVSGDLDPADIAFAADKGGASTAPGNYNSGIRLYQKSGSNAFGGYITLTAVAGCTIDEVQITTTATYSTTVAYSVDDNENLLGSENVAASSSYTTGTGLNVTSVNILNLGSGSSGRLEIASIKVYYTGEAAAIDHYELGGTYPTEFEVGDEFNHNGLIVYAAYDALGENKVDITSACTFSNPDMSTEGQKTIEITYKDAIVESYTITVNASTDTRKVAESPATFDAVSGDMNPADITFASYKGGAGNDPYLATTGIRLYQKSGSNAFGGFITLKAKKGCTIDQVKITTSNSYATTAAYSVDGNENLLGSESVAKSGSYSTPAGLNVESVNILNLGSGSDGRLEIASIKVYYTGDALAVDHYILGGTYETTFEQFGTFSYEGLTVTASYDAGETITEAVTGFTVEADLSTAGDKKAEVMLNSVKIAEYDITVTASTKVDPELAYTPSTLTITKGDDWSAPVLSNESGVSPISFVSDKPAIADVDENGVITLAGGIGTAVITASFAGDDDYLASEATYTITVNEPAEDLSGTWVVATSVAVGDRIIIADVAAAGVVNTMGEQASNNRVAVESSVDEYGVMTPAIGTKTFLVVDAGDGEFALQALNGNYLYAASTSSNHLKETSNISNVNAKWTITIENGVAAIKALHEGHTSRNWMRYNSQNDVFSCYSSGQADIVIYKIGTPDYGSYQRTVTAGNYGTICLPKAGVISGATLFEIADYDGSMIYVDEILSGEMEAGKPYIFQATSEQLNVVYTSSVVEETAGHANGLYGFYNLENENAQYDIVQDAGNYILYQNAYWLVKGRAAYIANYHAYIKLNQINNTGNQAPGRRRVAMAVNGEQVATGFENIDATEKPVKLMLNGQIYILRGEKLYDATGRLVK